jgi:hypothetical protein
MGGSFTACSTRPRVRRCRVGWLERVSRRKLVRRQNLPTAIDSSERWCNATLMSELAGDMHSRGKLLTAAVSAFGANADCVGTSVFNSVDYLNLMVYDIRDPNHSDYAVAVNSISYWKGKGLPASKTVLGLPFYSHRTGPTTPPCSAPTRRPRRCTKRSTA